MRVATIMSAFGTKNRTCPSIEREGRHGPVERLDALLADGAVLRSRA